MQEAIKEIIEQTFERLSCPFRNNGVYTEVREAILKAYSLGKTDAETGNGESTIPLELYNNILRA